MSRPTDTASKLLLSVDDLGSLLSVSRATIWRWLSAGRIPSPTLRQGQVVRWSRTMVEEWIAAGCPEPVERRYCGE